MGKGGLHAPAQRARRLFVREQRRDPLVQLPDLPQEQDEAALAAKWLGVQALIPMHYLGHEDRELAQSLAKTAPQIQLAVMKPKERLRFSLSGGIER